MGIRLAKATVVKVVDGDTVHTILDIGWGITIGPRMGKDPNFGTLRIVHADGSAFDTPEKGTPEGKAAKTFALALVKPGDVLPVVSYGPATDGRRTLASITLPDGRDWAAVMVEAGFGS